MSTLFVSDLHLDAARPRITDLFIDFVRDEATNADALYILGDLFEAWIGDDVDDPAGDRALACLIDRANEAGIEAITISPMLGDFNEDLYHRGREALRAQIRVQIAPQDVSRFMPVMA